MPRYDDDEDDLDSRPRRKRRRYEDEDDFDEQPVRRKKARAGGNPILLSLLSSLLWIACAIVSLGAMLWHTYMAMKSGADKTDFYLPYTFGTSVALMAVTFVVALYCVTAASLTLMKKVRSLTLLGFLSFAAAMLFVFAHAIMAMIVGNEAEKDSPVLKQGFALTLVFKSLFRTVFMAIPLVVAGILALVGNRAYQPAREQRQTGS
jgi:magnesium-transporting ATPase (P-type)